MMSREKTTSSPTLGRIYQHVARLTEGGGLLPQHAQHTALPDERAVAGARRRSEGRGRATTCSPTSPARNGAGDAQGREERLRQLFRWLRVSGRADSDPSEFLPTVKRPEPASPPVPDVVILAALSKATEGERLMLRLGAECGLRRSRSRRCTAATSCATSWAGASRSWARATSSASCRSATTSPC